MKWHVIQVDADTYNIVAKYDKEPEMGYIVARLLPIEEVAQHIVDQHNSWWAMAEVGRSVTKAMEDIGTIFNKLKKDLEQANDLVGNSK